MRNCLEKANWGGSNYDRQVAERVDVRKVWHLCREKVPAEGLFVIWIFVSSLCVGGVGWGGVTGTTSFLL